MIHVHGRGEKMNSILNTIKKLIGDSLENDSFDTDIIFFINSALATLNEIGIGSKDFRVSNKEETWDKFVLKEQANSKDLIIHYVTLKVKLAFDPPSSGIHKSIIDEQIKEIIWRLDKIASYGEIA